MSKEAMMSKVLATSALFALCSCAAVVPDWSGRPRWGEPAPTELMVWTAPMWWAADTTDPVLFALLRNPPPGLSACSVHVRASIRGGDREFLFKFPDGAMSVKMDIKPNPGTYDFTVSLSGDGCPDVRPVRRWLVVDPTGPRLRPADLSD